MGFGSYDESEQQSQPTTDDDVENVRDQEHEHEGELTFESDASADDLLNQLEDIKTNSE